MASADLRRELDCSICLNIYTDPVILPCGHNYCRVCIDRVLDTQGRSGGYSCPECRTEFPVRPALYRNITLCNIVENFRSTQPDEEKSEVFCTHCVDSPVPAVKSCLHCEASLCDKHLRVHSKSPEHVLCDPTTSLESRKCSVHKKILEYYCSVDGACICLACRLDGAHHGHQVKMLAAASEMKKEKLKTIHQKLKTKQTVAVRRILRLQEHQRKVMDKAGGEKLNITVLLGNLRGHLEDLEKKVLGEISGQAEKISVSIMEMTRELEIKKEELSRKMGDIEELCNMTDPLIVLQKSETGDLCDTEDGDDEDRERRDNLRDLDMVGISHTLYTGLSDIMSGINNRMEGAGDTFLDESTAGDKLQISVDGKTVTAFPSPFMDLPETPKRFKFSQVMSSQSFSSGRHYWEVEVGGSAYWDIGMCYPSVKRSWNPEICSQRDHPDLGEHKNKYWGIHRYNVAWGLADRNEHCPCSYPSSKIIRMYLDYEAGKISFYNPTVPITHICTFTATFTEPLHVVIGVWDDYGYLKICGERAINDQNC
ncbi:E3 ubiquitin-protein ligase TRIM39-like [Rana temporaria]|uniref:E3 ubiquitin-protein ligase TRIM39-like n=1 Tax=Rana temporaria TaxID=8407 RepID=UPI001AAD0DDF|nr:E3 ubiquitin-protein ligase TRIM39-like [Rana temporaria]